MAWLARVVAHLALTQPLVTILSVGLGVIAHVAHVLAFLLPLKVILLAGTDGIPKYFAPFMGQEDKPFAIVALSIGAVVCYVLAMYLDAAVQKLSARGSERILENSNAVSIVNNQEDETSDIFQRFVQLGAGSLFAAVVMAVLAWMNPVLFGFLAAGIAGSFIYLATTVPAEVDRKAVGNTLGVLTSVTFFVCFAVVLLPFVLEIPGRNILVAIISFVLMRRLLGVLPKVVRQSLKLASERPLISALVLPDHRLPRHEPGEGQTFRQTFEKPARVARVRAELERAGLIAEGAELDVAWVDPESRDFRTFEVRVREPAGAPTRLYLNRVLSPGREFLAENEAFLFANLSPEILRAPPLTARYREGDFDCLVAEIGPVGNDTEVGDEVVDDLLEQHWSIDPGPKLTAGYRASHQLLDERLTEKLVSRVGVAVDDDGEAETFEAFRRKLSRLRRELRGVPLYVFNPHLDPGHVYRRADGQALVASWGRWSLEPIGVKLTEDDSEEALEARLERLRAARPAVPEGLGPAHLRLASGASQLERQIERGMFKRALSTMAELLASPLLAGKAETAAAEPSPDPAKGRPGRASRRRADARGRAGDLPLAIEGER